MSLTFQRILVIQTAFIGDVILTLPLVQVLKRNFPDAAIDVVATPQASELFANHPAIGRVISFDKRGLDKGIRGFLRMKKEVSAGGYQLAVIPHRSLRSALLAYSAGIPRRIGFDKSAGKWFLTQTVNYRSDIHEIERDLSLLKAVGIKSAVRELPTLNPRDKDRERIDRLLHDAHIDLKKPLVAIAPGTIWNTKRWPKERFAEVGRRLCELGHIVVLVGSESDRALCEEIARLAKSDKIINTAGSLSLLESAELIRRSGVIATNDSAPMHMAVAVRTPVVAVFGATVPSFGFSPYGEADTVVETLGLACRPCSIHGGRSCPIKTFDCMINIESDRVFSLLQSKLDRSPRGH